MFIRKITSYTEHTGTLLLNFLAVKHGTQYCLYDISASL